MDSAALVLLGVVLMSWLSPKVWMFQGDLPITPQSLVVVLWGVLWGWQIGTVAVALYLVAGGLGAPVFADGASGWGHFGGSTAGFLFAFPIGALVAGWAAEHVSRFKYGASALLMLLGQLTVVVLGLGWQRGIVPVEVTWGQTLATLAPALLVKSALGALVVVFVGRALTGHKESEANSAEPGE
jgi:biotin transport system substrate-specific component